jgi:hypothetical protein
MLDAAIMDLHAPLDLAIDPAKAGEALERTHIILLKRAADIIGMSILHHYFLS